MILKDLKKEQFLRFSPQVGNMLKFTVEHRCSGPYSVIMVNQKQPQGNQWLMHQSTFQMRFSPLYVGALLLTEIKYPLLVNNSTYICWINAAVDGLCTICTQINQLPQEVWGMLYVRKVHFLLTSCWADSQEWASFSRLVFSLCSSTKIGCCADFHCI